jgi:two-component system chemotaxis sensor kinase CheA
MDELLDQFLIEGRELVEQAAADLMALERAPAESALIDSAFRAVHTLKGSVGLFDFAPFGRALHAAEDLLGAIRDGTLPADRPTCDALLDCIAASDRWIAEIAQTGHLPPEADEESRSLIGTLRARPARNADAAETFREGKPDWLKALIADNKEARESAAAAGRVVTALRYQPNADCFFLGDDPMALLRSTPELIAVRIDGAAPPPPAHFDPFACSLVIQALSIAPVEQIRQNFRFVRDQVVLATLDDLPANPTPATQAAEPERDAAARTLRVDAQRIDALADGIGELIVAKNRMAHLISRLDQIDPSLAGEMKANQSDIARLVADMHRAVMDVRMTPLSMVFRRFPRMVRDTAARLGKEIRFEMRGAELEADKTIVDGLFDPLMHVLRNAIDHGIEPVEARLAANKPAAGQITLDVVRQGAEVVIGVSDDGRGIEPKNVRRAARARRLMDDARLDALDDSGVLDLIFAPGFSTAETVTDISGRGVGMDAVRSTVARLGGQIALSSTPGHGTTVRLFVPQSVALTTIITIRVGDDRFGIPLDDVTQTVRIEAAQVTRIRDGAAFILRHETIPIVWLADLLRLGRSESIERDIRIVVVTVGAERIGVVVDGFEERAEVILRPLGGVLATLPGMRGAALLGDGRVLLVLDLPELMR